MSSVTSDNGTTALWAPDLVPIVTKLGDQATDIALSIQVLDPQDEDYGAYRPPDSYISGFPGGVASLLTTVYQNPDSKHYHSPALAENIRLAVEAAERFLYEDGSIDGGSDKQCACNSAFASGALCDLWRRWQEIDHPAAQEIVDRSYRIIVKFGHACRTMGMMTPNHRWVACVAMASINEIAPDERLIAKIDDYLSDGIDQDSDGFYSEYSPMYAMLCNSCLHQVATKLDRPELLEYVRRNLDLTLQLCHTGGEVASEFSVRADIGKLGTLHVLVEMARLDGKGEYLTVAREHLDRQIRTLDDRMTEAAKLGENSFGALLGETGEFLAAAKLTAVDVEPKPIPDDYRLRTSALVNRQRTMVRIRRGRLSLTAVGRNDFTNLMAVRYGDAVIDGMRMMYCYYGTHGVGDQDLPEENGEIVFQGSFTEYIDGPTPERRIDHKPELHYRLGISEIEDGIALSLKAHARHKVSVQVEFAVRAEGNLDINGSIVPMVAGECYFMKGEPVRIINGDDILEIGGDLVVQHREIGAGPFTKHSGTASLILAPRTPYEGVITLRGRHA
jgi:hypothetical protein